MPFLAQQAVDDEVVQLRADGERVTHGALEGEAEPLGDGAAAQRQCESVEIVYLYRGLVRCGLCGLRMTGNHRRTNGRRYYFCYPAKQRSAKIPEDHPKTIYLGEAGPHEAVTSWLATAILGPDRHAYWQANLKAADDTQPDHTEERLQEIEKEIADLTRRLRRQILNLEDDTLSTTAKRQVTDRIAELETQIEDCQAMADEFRHRDAAREPTRDEITQALDRLPEMAERLGGMPAKALRELYDSLDLKISYQPGDRSLDIEVTLAVQVCSVPPVGFEPTLSEV